MLKEHPYLRDARNSLGETVLHYLAVENIEAAVAWLHARGANLNVRNDFGTPVLFEIAYLHNRKLVKWFLENGVDVNVLDERDETSLLGYLREKGATKMIALLEQEPRFTREYRAVGPGDEHYDESLE